MRTGLEPRLDRLVRLGVQPAPAPAPPDARLAPQPPRPLRLVRLGPARRRQARIVRRLRRLPEPRFQLANPRRQRLDLTPLRQYDVDQLVLGKPGQRLAIHPQLESRRDSRVT